MKKRILACLVLSVLTTMLWARGATAEQTAVSLNRDRAAKTSAAEADEWEGQRKDSIWNQTLMDLDALPGEVLHLEFEGGGEARTVYGNGVYGEHSSIGSAAVHAGVITFEEGGQVTLVVQQGRAYYPPAKKNGISTTTGGSQDRSFAFLEDNSLVEAGPLEIDWVKSAMSMAVGTEMTVRLPPGGRDYFVFGGPPYHVNSAIGATAVHAGLITFEDGGVVRFEVIGKKPWPEGSSANGVDSLDAGEGKKSFRFIDIEK